MILSSLFSTAFLRVGNVPDLLHFLLAIALVMTLIYLVYVIIKKPFRNNEHVD